MNSYTMSEIKLFNRFELKYILPTSLIPILQEHFREYMIPDSHGDDTWWYPLSSLYYDTPELDCYREKIEWLKYRRKLRIRYYETQEVLTDTSRVYVEIKQRIDRFTQKRRVPMSYGNALRLCDQYEIPTHDPADAQVVDEIYHLAVSRKLQPTCITSYFRQAWMWTEHDPGLRITFDVNIRERHKDLQLHSKKIWRFMLPPDRTIMEVKANEHIPFWITELVSKYSLELTRISKYCQWLETASLVDQSVYYIQ